MLIQNYFPSRGVSGKICRFRSNEPFCYSHALVRILSPGQWNSELAASHPLETLNHAFKHGYPELCDKAALDAITRPRSESLEALVDPELRSRWVSIQTTVETCYSFLHIVSASL